MIRRALLFAGLIACALTPGSARAQGVDIIRGRVVTTDSQPVPNANVRVTSYSTQAVRQLRTDEKGRFSVIFQNGDLSLSNTVSWFNGNSKHRLKLGIESYYDWYHQLQAGNEQGVFTYSSLNDLENGTPASFTRRIGAETRHGDAFSAGLALGDVWRRTSTLQFQFSA
jgi:hypothetical protein